MHSNIVRVGGFIFNACVICSLFYLYFGNEDNGKPLTYHGNANAGPFSLVMIQGKTTISNEIPKVHFCNVFDWKTPQDGTFKCIHLNFTPETSVCLHPVGLDEHVSWTIEQTGMWEKHIVERVVDLLNHDENTGFLDIGSNIGVYSLVSAQLGHDVIAVEPYYPNVVRMQKAVQMSHLERKVTLVMNAISDTRETKQLILNKKNQGDIQVSSQTSNDTSHGFTSTSSIYLDDLLEVTRFPKAVMKIDIQGYEHRAFLKADRLLSKVNITCIFMEWFLLSSACNEGYSSRESSIMQISGMKLKKTDTAERIIETRVVFAMMDVLAKHYYKPYSLNGDLLRRSLCGQWPHDIVWIRRDHNYIIKHLKSFRGKTQINNF